MIFQHISSKYTGSLFLFIITMPNPSQTHSLLFFSRSHPLLRFHQQFKIFCGTPCEFATVSLMLHNLGTSGLVYGISFQKTLCFVKILTVYSHFPTCHQGARERGFRHCQLLSQQRTFLTQTRTRVRSVFQDLVRGCCFLPGSLTVKSQRCARFHQYNLCPFQSISEASES